MPAITLEQAEERLAAWLAADDAVSRGQSYAIRDRSLTRADAAEIRTNIEYWDKWVRRLQSGGNGARRVRYGVSDL